jgi:alkylation response protein AidB-like acyl-CoA dehydrogenase
MVGERLRRRFSAAEELGLVGLIIPRHGGAGYGPVELLIAMEEMGRALLAPFLGTSVFAARRCSLAPTRWRRRPCRRSRRARRS